MKKAQNYIGRHFKYLLGITCFLTLDIYSYGLTTILNDEDTDLLFYEFEQELYIDTTGKLNVYDVQSVVFEPNSDGLNAEMKPKEVRWYRIEVSNQSSRNWFLEFADAHISGVQLYRVLSNDSIVLVYTSGFNIPIADKTIQHKNHLFDLQVPKGTSGLFYARLVSDYPSSSMFHLRSLPYYLDYALHEYYLLGSFYGMLLIMACYSLLMFSGTRQTIYLYYILYLAGCVIFTFGEDNIGSHMVWANSNWPNHLFFKYGPLFWLIGFYLFSNSFLSLRSNSKISFWGITLCIPLSYFSIVMGLKIHYWLMLIAIGIAVLQGYIKWRSGLRYARYFTVGYSLVLLGILIYVLRATHVIYTDIIIYYSTYISFIVEALVFAFAMSDRIRQIRKDREKAQQSVIDQLKINDELKEKVNKELESKVQERTEQLHIQSARLSQANEELKKMSHELQTMNEAMDKENWQLQRLVKEAKKQKLEKKLMDFTDFKEVYPDNLTCLRFLSELKWGENYTCKKCKHTNYMRGEKPHSRKCTSCKYDESPTSGTLFQGVRFDLIKAFFIAYHSAENKQPLTIDQLSEMLELRRNTAWAFRKKVKKAIEQKSPESWLELLV